MAPFQVHIHTVKSKEKRKSAIAAVYVVVIIIIIINIIIIIIIIIKIFTLFNVIIVIVIIISVIITQKNIQNWTEHSLREQDIQTQIFFAGGEPPHSYNKRKKKFSSSWIHNFHYVSSHEWSEKKALSNILHVGHDASVVSQLKH